MDCLDNWMSVFQRQGDMWKIVPDSEGGGVVGGADSN